MSDLINREDVQREIQVSFDEGAFRWQDGQDLMDRINALPAAPRWVRVEDELPDKNTNVLFYDENGYFHDGIMSRFRGYTEFIDYDGNTLHGITHWMPIEPPEEEV